VARLLALIPPGRFLEPVGEGTSFFWHEASNPDAIMAKRKVFFHVLVKLIIRV